MSTSLPPLWAGLVDDAAIFPPGNSPLPDAVTAYLDRSDQWYAGLVGSFVVSDTAVADLPRDRPMRLSVVVTGGAGAIPGALRLVERSGHSLAGLEVALRDPDDLPGNARRVLAAADAARADGLLDEGDPIFVELPQSATTPGWLAAADVVAEAELRLKFRTGGLDPDMFPTAATLAGWIDAALDRETPFKCTAGLHHALRHTSAEDFEQHGFVNVLLATRLAFDGAPSAEVTDVLEQRDRDSLLALWHGQDPDALARTRRWFTSYGSCSVRDPLDDLLDLGLLEEQ